LRCEAHLCYHALRADAPTLCRAVQGFTWPVFKWAGGADDKYFAKIGKNAISIYEARPVLFACARVLCQYARGCAVMNAHVPLIR
jgi:hypothetical protein